MEDILLVVDSSCELTPELTSYFRTEIVPFALLLEGVNHIDDGTINIPNFLADIKKSKHIVKSACPSPDAYAQHFRKAKHVFVVTISSKLSGSYNSAVQAQRIVESEGGGQKIHVFDSESASAGEILICMKLRDCIEAGMTFEETVEHVENFVKHEQHTFFVLENLDTLIKAGRMKKIVGYVATVMSLRPVMTAIGGEIELFEKARGSLRAFTRLVEVIGEKCTDTAQRMLVITHCNNLLQAEFIKSQAQKLYQFKEIAIMQTRGLATTYANDGGVIVSF